MAFYLLIDKMSEDDLVAIYRFTGDGGRTGSFQIDKESGDVSLVEPMPGDEQGRSFNRAAVKIMREWKQGNLPVRAEWAS